MNEPSSPTPSAGRQWEATVGIILGGAVAAVVLSKLAAKVSPQDWARNVEDWVRGWVVGMSTLWALRFCVAWPPIECAYRVDNGLLVWTKSRNESPEKRPLVDLVRLVEWVGFEQHFSELIWRDGTRWRIRDHTGAATSEFFVKLMADHGLTLKVERKGVVLRAAELGTARQEGGAVEDAGALAVRRLPQS